MTCSAKTEHGFSLLELIISIGILAIIGGVSSVLVLNLYRTSSHYLALEEYNDIYRNVQLLLMDKVKCPYVLRDATGVANTISYAGALSTNVDGLYSYNSATGGSSLIAKSNTVVGNRIQIGAISISEVTSGSSRTNEWSLNSSGVRTFYNTYLINVNIPARVKSSNMQLASKPLPVKIYVNPGNANKIEACAAQVQESSTCGSFGGIYDSTTAKCVMPLCDATTATIPCTPDLAASGWRSCQPKQYYWVIVQTGTTAATQSAKCLCDQRCLPP